MLPVCVICSDRTRPGKRLKSNIMKYLAGSSPLMGSRSAAGARAQQPKALRTDAELPGTDFYFYFYFYFYFFSNFSVCQKQTRSAARAGFHQLNPAKPDFVFPRLQEALAVVHRAYAEASCCFFFFSAVDKLM